MYLHYFIQCFFFSISINIGIRYWNWNSRICLVVIAVIAGAGGASCLIMRRRRQLTFELKLLYFFLIYWYIFYCQYQKYLPRNSIFLFNFKMESYLNFTYIFYSNILLLLYLILGRQVNYTYLSKLYSRFYIYNQIVISKEQIFMIIFSSYT